MVRWMRRIGCLILLPQLGFTVNSVPELQQLDLLQALDQAEAFALNQYLPALAKGAMLTGTERQQMAAQVAKFSGLSVAGGRTARTWIFRMTFSGKSCCVTVDKPWGG